MSTAEVLAEVKQEVKHATQGAAPLALESPTLGKLAEALAKAQGAMESASKDSTNPHFKSRYADLASIREAIRKPLAENGLAYWQRTSSTPGGVRVETTLAHVSGEYIRDSLWLPVAQQTPQAYGSAITYAKRYSLAALVGVTSDEDDDGNAASGSPSPSLAAQHGSQTERVKSAVQAHSARHATTAREPGDDDEPPPPSAEYEPERSEPSVPPADLALPFGKSKGILASLAPEKDLLWVLQAMRANLDDPSKAKFRAKTVHDVAILESICRHRGLST